MIRNFNKTESTKKLLSDVKHMSWHSTRSAFSTTSATHHSGSDNSHRQQRSNAVTKRSLSKHDKVKLPVELSVQPSLQSPFTVETVVRRHGNTYKMDLQLPNKSYPLFVAEQHGQTYIFKSDPSNHKTSQQIVMGTVCKKPSSEGGASNKKKNNTLTYALTHHEHAQKPQKIAYLEYDSPSMFQLLSDATKKQPRRCRVHISGRSASETKEPYSKEGGRQRSLDFYGRGREASRKNMQLVDSTGKLILQMVKWSKDEFHVDFNYPFDAFHAFGFVLAQFDMS